MAGTIHKTGDLANPTKGQPKYSLLVLPLPGSPPPHARAAVRSGGQPPLVANATEELFEDRPATATKPGGVGVRFPCTVGFGVACPLDFELSCSSSRARADYALDVVLGLTSTCGMYWAAGGSGPPELA